MPNPQSKSAIGVAAIEGLYWTSEGYGDAVRLVGQAVTPDFFRVGIRRMLMFLLSAFGGITLLLATIGIYSIVAQEIGIRMALGARQLQIVLHFMREGLYSGALGLVLGVVARTFAQRWVAGMLYQVRPSDAASFCVTAAGTLAQLSIALWWPARRASQVNPHDAVRRE